MEWIIKIRKALLPIYFFLCDRNKIKSTKMLFENQLEKQCYFYYSGLQTYLNLYRIHALPWQKQPYGTYLQEWNREIEDNSLHLVSLRYRCDCCLCILRNLLTLHYFLVAVCSFQRNEEWSYWIDYFYIRIVAALISSIHLRLHMPL